MRATLTVSFKEYRRAEIEIQRGLFVVPPTVRNIAAGETLSSIAGQVLGDPGAWRAIADANNIHATDQPALLSFFALTVSVITSRESTELRALVVPILTNEPESGSAIGHRDCKSHKVNTPPHERRPPRGNKLKVLFRAKLGSSIPTRRWGEPTGLRYADSSIDPKIAVDVINLP